MPRAVTFRFLVGPTAVGKSAAGVILAERLGAEIISLDSMAIYSGMDIGTAKPGPDEKARLPHHMIDVAETWQSYSVAKYVAQAERTAREIFARGKEVLFVGGTGLYLKRFVEGIFAAPQADRAFRDECRERAMIEGVDALHEELRARRPRHRRAPAPQRHRARHPRPGGPPPRRPPAERVAGRGPRGLRRKTRAFFRRR